jgi:hypothetical protein
LPAEEIAYAPSSPGASAVHYAQKLLEASRPHVSVADVKPAPQRTQWEHVRIHPDIELHVRQPLSGENRRKLDALLAQARILFQE